MILEEIEVFQEAFFEIDVVLSGKTLTLVFRWNEEFEFYTMDVFSRGLDLILKGIKIIKNAPLIGKYAKMELPPYGDLFVQDTGTNSDQPSLETFGERFILIWADWTAESIAENVKFMTL